MTNAGNFDECIYDNVFLMLFVVAGAGGGRSCVGVCVGVKSGEEERSVGVM